MPRIVAISGSPSRTSRTARLLDHIAGQLAPDGEHDVVTVAVRDLPAEPLLRADLTHPAIVSVIEQVGLADGVIVASPIYKAAYSGALKTLLDLLPQYALAGKVVLPLVTGGSPAHVLAIDYALRPVLTAMGAGHVVPGYFLLDRLITVPVDGPVSLDPGAETALHAALTGFLDALGGRVPRPLVVAAAA
jgi:FMN reductase